ncbi:MAG: hypothetical protein EOO01_27985, partial [Chitinophagaceae bacterium]
MTKYLVTIAVLLVTVNRATSQSLSQLPNHLNTPKVSVLFGLNQPLVLHGFNVEVDYWTRKWVFEYSHGVGLNVDGKMLGDEYERQQISFKLPHSLRVGVGYRFTEALNIRLEPKIHFYEAYYNDQDQKSSQRLVDFSTYTVGLGAYYKWQPFEQENNFLKGITVVPSIRYWQKVGSSLKKNQFTYQNNHTQREETLKAPNIGIA